MRFLLPLFGVVAAFVAAQTAPAPAFEGLDESIATLAKITGLAPLKKVQYDTITKAQVKAFLEERIKEEVKPEDIRIDELALKKFGFVPKDFDLKRTTVDLITEQAAAFYDYRKKKLFLLSASDAPPSDGNSAFAAESQKMIVVHELAHALADQHFDLGKFIKHGRSDDASTARMAVMEGQATWLMLEAMASRMGASVREMPQMAEIMGAGATEAMAAQYPVLANAPLYIRTSLIFPYNQGLKFQHALVQKLGNEAFSRVFREAPISTQQIMHPEVYLSRTQPVSVPVPVLAKPKDWKTITEGTVGELDHAVLLEQYLSKKDADELAPKWRGGTFALAENKSGKHVGLLYASQWADAESARRMFEAYQGVLKAKWSKMSVKSSTEKQVEGEGDDGLFRLTLDGSRVASVEGLKAAGEFARQLN
jgi:hypothetical protein